MASPTSTPTGRKSLSEGKLSSGILTPFHADTPTPPSSPDSGIWEDSSDSWTSGGEVECFSSQLLSEDICSRMRRTERQRTHSLPRSRRLCCTGVEVSPTREMSDGVLIDIDGAHEKRRSKSSLLVHFHCWLARQPHTWL